MRSRRLTRTGNIWGSAFETSSASAFKAIPGVLCLQVGQGRAADYVGSETESDLLKALAHVAA
jgi:hypothetical protein